MRTLYGLAQSPWTEKARWALDHHTIAYRYHEHVPLIGELLLRNKARSRPKGTKASVPLLADGNDVFCNSFVIAHHAEAIGRGAELFPKAHEDAISHWADLSDRIIGVGRTQVLARMRTNREAQREALPSFIPGALRGALAPMSVTAVSFLGSKYDVSKDPEGDAETILRPALDEIRESLEGSRDYLLDGFTFADVAVAAALQAVRPRARSKLGPGTRAIWTNDVLAGRYGDILDWRDAIYAKHRDVS